MPISIHPKQTDQIECARKDTEGKYEDSKHNLSEGKT